MNQKTTDTKAREEHTFADLSFDRRARFDIASKMNRNISNYNHFSAVFITKGTRIVWNPIPIDNPSATT